MASSWSRESLRVSRSRRWRRRGRVASTPSTRLVRAAARSPRRRLHDHQSVDTRRRGDLRGLRPRHGSPDIGQRRPRLRRRPREPGLVLLRVYSYQNAHLICSGLGSAARLGRGTARGRRAGVRCRRTQGQSHGPPGDGSLVARPGPAPVQAHAPDPGFVKMHGLRRAGRARQVAQEGP